MLVDGEYKYKDIAIGILIGLIVMTKQNIGGCLALLYLITSKNRINSVISILIGILPSIIYLGITNSFLEYIDFCYIGLGSFLDNFVLEPLSLGLWIICLYVFLKQTSGKKNIVCYYILVYQIVVFPIVDQGHVVPAIIPIVYYLLLNYNKKIGFYIKMFTTIGFVMIAIILPIIRCEFNTNNNFLKYQVQSNGLNYYMKNYSNYVDNIDDKKIYLLVENAYIIKLYRNETLDFYDLINDGNFGTMEKELIADMDNDCKNKKCIFILDNRYFKNLRYFQYSKRFKKHVMKKYKYIETMPSKDRVYSN